MAAKHPRARLDTFIERQILESVQGVVMNKNCDRALRRQQMPRVFDRVLQPNQSSIGASGAREVVHGKHRLSRVENRLPRRNERATVARKARPVTQTTGGPRNK